MRADPIRGPAQAQFDQQHRMTLMLVTIEGARHRSEGARHRSDQGNTGSSNIAPGRVPVGLRLDGDDDDAIPVVPVDTMSATNSAGWNSTDTGSWADLGVWGEMNTRSSDLAAMWDQDAGERTTAGNLDPVPESSSILPLGLLAGGVLLFRKRLVATR
jgi:hypothetical protein